MQGTWTILLLTFSNVFMTFAWYGHLRFRSAPLLTVIVISWLIAFLEYCFQVPANRIGSYVFSAAQLKIIQEVITLIVFCVFSVVYLKQQLHWNYLIAFLLLVGAVYFVFSADCSASPDLSCVSPSVSGLKPRRLNEPGKALLIFSRGGAGMQHLGAEDAMGGQVSDGDSGSS